MLDVSIVGQWRCSMVDLLVLWWARFVHRQVIPLCRLYCGHVVQNLWLSQRTVPTGPYKCWVVRGHVFSLYVCPAGRTRTNGDQCRRAGILRAWRRPLGVDAPVSPPRAVNACVCSCSEPHCQHGSHLASRLSLLVSRCTRYRTAAEQLNIKVQG